MCYCYLEAQYPQHSKKSCYVFELLTKLGATPGSSTATLSPIFQKTRVACYFSLNQKLIINGIHNQIVKKQKVKKILRDYYLLITVIVLSLWSRLVDFVFSGYSFNYFYQLGFVFSEILTEILDWPLGNPWSLYLSLIILITIAYLGESRYLKNTIYGRILRWSILLYIIAVLYFASWKL